MYAKLDIVKFGHHLLATGDLDPVYIALPRALSGSQRDRWLVAYWCFYSCGFACWASEQTGDNFWRRAMEPAAANTSLSPAGGRWPRGHERRHARGQAGLRMVGDLRERYGSRPEKMVDYVAGAAPSYVGVAQRTQEHTLFGPWIAFKVADMLERVCGTPVDFSEAVVFMFKEPAASAVMLWKEEIADTAPVPPQEEMIIQSVDYLRGEFGHMTAPPDHSRPVGLQELETILCKWKSHRSGHYPLLNDIHEVGESCWQWSRVSKTARAFFEAMPEGARPCAGTLL